MVKETHKQQSAKVKVFLKAYLLTSSLSHAKTKVSISVCQVFGHEAEHFEMKKRLLRMHLTPSNTCGEVARGEEALLVCLSLIQGSDGSGDRGALFLHSEETQHRAVFPGNAEWPCGFASILSSVLLLNGCLQGLHLLLCPDTY